MLFLIVLSNFSLYIYYRVYNIDDCKTNNIQNIGTNSIMYII